MKFTTTGLLISAFPHTYSVLHVQKFSFSANCTKKCMPWFRGEKFTTKIRSIARGFRLFHNIRHTSHSWCILLTFWERHTDMMLLVTCWLPQHLQTLILAQWWYPQYSKKGAYSTLKVGSHSWKTLLFDLNIRFWTLALCDLRTVFNLTP